MEAIKFSLDTGRIYSRELLFITFIKDILEEAEGRLAVSLIYLNELDESIRFES